MSKSKRFIGYFLLFCSTFLIDQITKFWALKNLDGSCFVNSFLSFSVGFNRGISWGFFNSDSSLVFTIVSALILIIVVALLIYLLSRFFGNNNVFAETLVFSGAFSNLLDRFAHKGVVDFICFSYGSWSWPAFNLADAFIVVGAIYMFIVGIKNQ